ncbi:hypothetical protein, partial [Acinetobacter nectaris]
MLTRFLGSVVAGCVSLAMLGLSPSIYAAKKPHINPTTLTVIGYHEVTNQANDALIPFYAVSTE